MILMKVGTVQLPTFLAASEQTFISAAAKTSLLCNSIQNETVDCFTDSAHKCTHQRTDPNNLIEDFQSYSTYK